MNITDYINFLKNKNIILYDYEYRISHFKIKKILSINQNGGSSFNNNFFFKNKSNEEIKYILNVSMSNNTKLGYLYYLLYK